MRAEISTTANFLVQLLEVRSGYAPDDNFSDDQLDNFRVSFTQVLEHLYLGHWYPEAPSRGSGFQCLRINEKMDPRITRAAVNVGLKSRLLRASLPKELTIWIDPLAVTYRLGETGKSHVLYVHVEYEEFLSRPSSAASSSTSI